MMLFKLSLQNIKKSFNLPQLSNINIISSTLFVLKLFKPRLVKNEQLRKISKLLNFLFHFRPKWYIMDLIYMLRLHGCGAYKKMEVIILC